MNLASLPVVSQNGQPFRQAQAPVSGSVGPAAPAGSSDVIALLERLGSLKSQGILTDSEFNAKKAELLSRL